jgi:Lrp/AsnC family leucine-responsive transcriptional regulator
MRFSSAWLWRESLISDGHEGLLEHPASLHREGSADTMLDGGRLIAMDMDTLDLAILRSLQADGRRPNADLAREHGVAPSTILERVRSLEKHGVITGYRALIDADAIGLGAQALVSATLAYDQIDVVERFQEAVANMPEVRACYGISGRYDYMLHVVARDMGHLRDILHTRINTIPGPIKTETFIVLGEVKPDSGLPLDAISADGPDPVTAPNITRREGQSE